MSSMLYMRSSRLWCLSRQPINYVKVQTSTNNPKISQKMRYSQIVNSTTRNTKTISIPVAQRIIVPLTN